MFLLLSIIAVNNTKLTLTLNFCSESNCIIFFLTQKIVTIQRKVNWVLQLPYSKYNTWIEAIEYSVSQKISKLLNSL